MKQTYEQLEQVTVESLLARYRTHLSAKTTTETLRNVLEMSELLAALYQRADEFEERGFKSLPSELRRIADHTHLDASPAELQAAVQQASKALPGPPEANGEASQRQPLPEKRRPRNKQTSN